MTSSHLKVLKLRMQVISLSHYLSEKYFEIGSTLSHVTPKHRGFCEISYTCYDIQDLINKIVYLMYF